jgi:thiazole synthase ThiGH ThiG subunit
MSEGIDHLRSVGVVLARRKIDNPWIDHAWAPHSIFWPAPQTEPNTVLADEEALRLVYLGEAAVELFVAETANYRDNLISGAPGLWVAARSDASGGVPQLVRVTADPTEGEALFEAGCDIVAPLPMPPELASWIGSFVEAFHVEREFLKRKRDRKDRPFERGPRREGQP